jgi:hypothetical protein
VIRSQATEFRYERSRQPLPRIDPWRDQLDGLLLENAGKSARERLTLIRIFEELRAFGYEAATTRSVDTPRGGVPSAAPRRAKRERGSPRRSARKAHCAAGGGSGFHANGSIPY